MNSTFQDLIDRVETTNLTLERVRDTIENEAIDLGSSLIDTMREIFQPVTPMAMEREDGSNKLADEERYREDRRLVLDELGYLNNISMTVDSIYQLMLQNDKENLPNMPNILPLGGPRVGALGGGKEGRGRPGIVSGVGDFFKGLLKRVIKGGIVLLITNELMNFFGLTLDDVVKKGADLIRDFELPSLSNFGATIDEQINKIIDIGFSEQGGLEDGLKQSLQGAAIGYMIGGPYGGLIGAALGFVSGYFTSEEAKVMYGKVKEETSKALDSFLLLIDDAVKLFTGDPETWAKLELGMKEAAADVVNGPSAEITQDNIDFETFTVGNQASVNKSDIAQEFYDKEREELVRAVKKLNTRGTINEESIGKLMQAQQDLLAGMDRETFNAKYGKSAGLLFRTAPTTIQERLTRLREQNTELQQTVERERIQYEVARENLASYASVDNSVNITAVATSRFENFVEPKSWD